MEGGRIRLGKNPEDIKYEEEEISEPKLADEERGERSMGLEYALVILSESGVGVCPGSVVEWEPEDRGWK